MALFTVLESPSGRPDKVALIREGFSFWAAMFTVFWALSKRMWVVAVLLFAVFVGLALAQQMFRLDSMLLSATELAVSLIFGFQARTLQELSLTRAGYRAVSTVSANNHEAAELQYFASLATDAGPLAVSTPPRLMLPAVSPQHDALGLFGPQ